MKIAITGGSGFIGGYIVERLLNEEHDLRCWHRDPSRIDPRFQGLPNCEWVYGELGDEQSTRQLVSGCDAVVHAALWRPGASFRGGEGEIIAYCQKNLMGSLQLIEASWTQSIRRFVFISTCAVHEQILEDRKLDEAHPLWPLSHYGAHKAAIEKFVHSYGFGKGFPICALRPTGVYGMTNPVSNSKWYDLIEPVVNGQPVSVKGGGKEVHAADIAKAILLLLNVDEAEISGQAFNCYDQYISQFDVVRITQELTGSCSEISGTQKVPLHKIDTSKIRGLGMRFGGEALLRQTISDIIATIRPS